MRHDFINLGVVAKHVSLVAAIIALCATGKSASAATGNITAVYPAPGSVVDAGYIGVGGDVKMTTDDYGCVVHSMFDFKKDGAALASRLETFTSVGAHEVNKTFTIRMVNQFTIGKYTATYFAVANFFDRTSLSGSLPTNFEVRMGINNDVAPAPGGDG